MARVIFLEEIGLSSDASKSAAKLSWLPLREYEVLFQDKQEHIKYLKCKLSFTSFDQSPLFVPMFL